MLVPHFAFIFRINTTAAFIVPYPVLSKKSAEFVNRANRKKPLHVGAWHAKAFLYCNRNKIKACLLHLWLF
jgi:hypothetical protein